MIRQREFEQDGRLVEKEPHNVDDRLIISFLKDKLIARDIPVTYWLVQLSFKDHVAFLTPHLEQVPSTVDNLDDGLVDYLDKHRAKVGTLIELAAGHDPVQLVERHRVHDHLHKVFRRLALVFLQFVLSMLLFHLCYCSTL